MNAVVIPGFALAAALAAAAPLTGLPDPTRPPADVRRAAVAAAAPAAAALELSAVRLAPGRKVARINGRSVHEGDRVGDLTVVRIALDGVELAGDTGTLRLRLGAAVKRPAAQGPGGQRP